MCKKMVLVMYQLNLVGLGRHLYINLFLSFSLYSCFMLTMYQYTIMPLSCRDCTDMSGGLCIYIFYATLSPCHAGTLSMYHVEPVSIFKKSHIRETQNLSTDAECSTAAKKLLSIF